jgi:ABC-2 type transport system permease protein
VVLVAFLASLGLAVGFGAYVPGTAPRTGGNPFAATSGGAAQGCLTAIVSFVGPMLLTLPVVVVVVLTSGAPLGRWVALVLGTLYGLGLLATGVVVGGRRIDRRAPELLGQLHTAQM